MLDPWYGAMTPMLVRSATQFQPPPPPGLMSAEYTRDFAEVKAYGSVNSSVRTPEQTATALFYSGNTIVQDNTALRDQMTARHLDIVDTARMYAATNVSVVDALMTVWRAKLFYGLWRPITAINLADTDGNPATTADLSWVPLVTTPAYPEYSSGYNVLTAAYTGGLAELFHTDRLNLNLTSTAVPGAVRHYGTGAAVRADVVNARVWLGFHFRFSDVASRDLGLGWSTGPPATTSCRLAADVIRVRRGRQHVPLRPVLRRRRQGCSTLLRRAAADPVWMFARTAECTS